MRVLHDTPRPAARLTRPPKQRERAQAPPIENRVVARMFDYSELVEVRGRWWNGKVRHEALSIEWGWETFTRLLS